YNFESKQGVSIQTIFQQFKESERMTGLKQYAIISASAVNQAALEDPRIGHGVLTYYFLQTLAGKYTFFLSKKIAFFKFLAILDKKVRNHRFLTDTGRKATLKMLRENGIMVHWHDTNFELPVLEPTPLILDPKKSALQQKLFQWAHFFTCTRLRTKFYLMIGILFTILILIFTAHMSMVRIHFEPRQSALFHDTLLGNPVFFLDKLNGSKLREKNSGERRPYQYKNFNCYLFKHNWVDALLGKLEGSGRIILLGNLLGFPITGVHEKQMMDFALWYNNDIFYWNPNDVMKIINKIRKEYKNFNGNRVRNALTLLAKLGKNGKAAAVELFDFKGETFQRYRNLFLKHFYSLDYWARNFEDFKPGDYLFLIKEKRPLPLLKKSTPDERFQQYLDTVARSLPDSYPGVGMVNREGIYGKLGILAFFGSTHFRKKADGIFQNAFNVDEVLDLFWFCRKLSDKVWLLEQFLKRAPHINISRFFWTDFIAGYVNKLPVKEKSHLLKRIMDSAFQLVPKSDRYILAEGLEDADASVIHLNDWENWIKKNQIHPIDTILAIVPLKYPKVFHFLEIHRDYFKGNFSRYVLDSLYKTNQHQTVKLVKKLYKSSPKDRFNCAVFLVNKNYHEYASYIVDFLEQVNKHQQYDILLGCYFGPLNETLMRIAEKNHRLKNKLMYLLTDKKLFYGFYPFISRFWPEEAKKILLASKITRKSTGGIPLRKFIEHLPDGPRKKILTKILIENNDEDFKSAAESILAKYYPEEFVKLVYTDSYVWHRFTREHVIKAFQSFSYEMLRQGLDISLKKGVNVNVRLICWALVNKEADKELQIQGLQDILEQFNRPEERIMLRKIRHYLNKRHFNQQDEE
ncbi:MAG: hypothetical protein PVH61_43830, partial [Candidatus Aminicenantes bacterium]